MAEQIDLSQIKDLGVSPAFQQWLSTLVDIINSDLEKLEMTIGSGLFLTRVDTSATSNIQFSELFKDYLTEIVEKLNSIDERLQALEK